MKLIIGKDTSKKGWPRNREREGAIVVIFKINSTFLRYWRISDGILTQQLTLAIQAVRLPGPFQRSTQFSPGFLSTFLPH